MTVPLNPNTIPIHAMVAPIKTELLDSLLVEPEKTNVFMVADIQR